MVMESASRGRVASENCDAKSFLFKYMTSEYLPLTTYISKGSTEK